MTEPAITLDDITALRRLANGIIPPDARDAGAAAVECRPGPRRAGATRRQRAALRRGLEPQRRRWRGSAFGRRVS